MDPAWAQRKRLAWESCPEKTPRDWRKTMATWWFYNDGVMRNYSRPQESVWSQTKNIEKLRAAIAEHPFNEAGSAFVGNDFEATDPEGWSKGKADLAAICKRLREIEAGLAK